MIDQHKVDCWLHDYALFIPSFLIVQLYLLDSIPADFSVNIACETFKFTFSEYILDWGFPTTERLFFMATINKTKKILDYLTKNPGHTWKIAKPKLEKYGITGGYFSMVKSKNFGKTATNDSPTGKKRGPKSKKTQAVGGVSDLQHAAEFAKSVGGIENALNALNQLEKVQIN